MNFITKIRIFFFPFFFVYLSIINTYPKKNNALRPSLEKKHQVCEIPVYSDLSGICAFTITVYQLIIKYCILSTVHLRITINEK